MSAKTTLCGAGLALLVSALLVPAPAPADDMLLHLNTLVIEVLDVDVDTGSSKFNEYTDVNSGFGLPEVDVEAYDDASGRHLGFRAADVERDDARYTLSYGVWGKYGLEVDYNKIPHRFGSDARFIETRTAPGRWEIPDASQAFLQGSLEDASSINPEFIVGLLQSFLDTAQRLDVGLQRDRTNVDFSLGGLAGLSWNLSYAQENRTGLRPYGGSFGFGNVVEVAETIDYRTSSAELRGEWNSKKAGVQFGYRHSIFENDISTMYWDNPFRITDGTDGRAYIAPGGASINGAVRGFADLYPDNEADHLFVNGRAKVGSWWVQGNLVFGNMSQDDPLLPYTLNTAIVGEDFDGSEFDPTDPANLPVRNADLDVDTLSFNGDAGTTFADRFHLAFKLRYYDYDNKSPRIEFPGYVRFHAVWEEVPRITVPYSYTKDTVGASFTWDVTDSQNLELYYDLNTWDRKFRETNKTEEDVVGLKWDGRFEDFMVRAGYEIGDRTIDGEYLTEAQEYSFLEPEGINNQPGLRKSLQAAREYDEFSARVQWFPNDTVDVALFVLGRDEDYDESEFGLISSDQTSYGFEAGYAPGAGVAFYLFAQREDLETFQRARQSGGSLSTNPADDWEATFDETTDTVGLGVTRSGVDRWTLNLDLRWSNSDGGANFFSPPGGTPDTANGFDNYDDVELLGIRCQAEYSLNESVSAGVSYRYEDYTIQRFLIDDLEQYIASAILLLQNEGDYTANVFGVHLRFRI